MSLQAIADTHALHWYVLADQRLSHNARIVMDQILYAGDEIGISSISFYELVYLIEKRKIPAETLSRLAREFSERSSGLVEIKPSLELARYLSKISSSKVPDLPDRMIAATALYLGVPLISRDAKIQVSGLSTIW